MKPKPPHKKKEDLFLLIRHDRYKIEGNEIYLLDFNLRLKFKGNLKWVGKQGTLEMFYDNARRKRYAKIPMVVKVNNKSKGKMKAGIDLGVINLATVAVQDARGCSSKGVQCFQNLRR